MRTLIIILSIILVSTDVYASKNKYLPEKIDGWEIIVSKGISRVDGTYNKVSGAKGYWIGGTERPVLYFMRGRTKLVKEPLLHIRLNQDRKKIVALRILVNTKLGNHSLLSVDITNFVFLWNEDKNLLRDARGQEYRVERVEYPYQPYITRENN